VAEGQAYACVHTQTYMVRTMATISRDRQNNGGHCSLVNNPVAALDGSPTHTHTHTHTHTIRPGLQDQAKHKAPTHLQSRLRQSWAAVAQTCAHTHTRAWSSSHLHVPGEAENRIRAWPHEHTLHTLGCAGSLACTVGQTAPAAALP